MAEKILSRDWSETPLGPIESWPQSLRTTVSLCLASNFPINVIWGPEHIQIYNDGYSPICGAKNALGENYTISWASAWPILERAFEHALAGQTSFLQNTRMFLDRNGYLEETFFTFSLSPIRDESGGIGGLFHPVTETTANMLTERRMRALRDLAAQAGEAKTVEEACRLALRTLGGYQLDLPFLLLYLSDAHSSGTLRLAGQAHLAAGTRVSPLALAVGAEDPDGWPVAEALTHGATAVSGIDARFGTLECGPYPESPHAALVLPIHLPGVEESAGVLIAGTSPRLPVDEAYRDFCELVAAGVSAAIANARAHEEQRQRAEELAALDRAKTAFFSNVSHEFRTPLTLILGPVEDILARLGSPEPAAGAAVALEEIALIHRNTQRLLKLVNTLLEFSRIEAGRVQARFGPVELAGLTRDLASVFRSAVERAGVRLTIECPPLVEPVYVDRDMWEKIVLNLVSNAFKFTLAGEIRVSLERRDKCVELEVQDTGTGIPAEELPRIFERFKRVEGARGRTYEGTGIGLAMVRELAQLHGGSVGVVSVEEQGSTFTVSIPLGCSHLRVEQLVAGHAEAAAPPGSSARAFVEEASSWPSPQAGVREGDSNFALEAPPATGEQPRGRVLLADDNTDMREYVARLLGEQFEVEAVSNGEEALRAARRQPPDLVLSDVMMPVLDGFGLLQALRADPATAGVPVILLSARAGEEARVEGVGAGADDYLVKPFSARELRARVEALIGLARRRRAIAHKEEVRDSEERLRAIVEQSGAGLAEMDLERRFVLVNDQYCAITGRSREELLGKRMEDITYAEDLPRNLVLLQAAVEQGAPYTVEKRHPRPDGSLIWVTSHVNPLRDRAGKTRGLLAVSIDVTRRRQVEDDLRRANAELEEFGYVASHDLQEPLRMVSVYTQLLVGRYVDEQDQKAKQYADLIRNGVLQMQAQIRDLLAFSRVIHEDCEQDASTDLKSALDQAMGNLETRIEEAGGEISHDALPVVRGEARQLTQVLQNLLSNALKFRSAAAPAIHVGAIRQGRDWLISVRDNGIGFEIRFAGRIFGIFKRLHKDDYPGSGIGLTICKHVVERNGGRIWAESSPGIGSTFFFTLPAVTGKE